jgi:Tfp pilus assembly protein PilN
MRAVNLLPADAARRKRRRVGAAAETGSSKRVLATAAAVAAVLVLALGAAFVQAHRTVSDRQSTLEGLEQDVAAAQAKAAEVQAARSSAQARRVAVTDVTSKRITWEQVLRDLARALPTNVQLETLQAQSPTPTVSSSTTAVASTTPATTGAAPTAFTVTGFTGSQRSVARVIDRLSALPWLSDVSLQQTTRQERAEGGNAVQFTIGANLGSIGGK